MGLRERKKRERRRRIEEAAIDLFERDGFDATTIEQIAAAADIAPRTFFSYFDTKDDVVLADYADRLERVIGVLSTRPPGEPAWTALRASFAAVSADFAAEAEGLARRFAIITGNPSVQARSLQLQAGWEAALSVHLADRLDVPIDSPEPSLLAATAVAVLRSSVQHWLAHDRATSLPDLVQRGFDQIGSGLAAL